MSLLTCRPSEEDLKTVETSCGYASADTPQSHKPHLDQVSGTKSSQNCRSPIDLQSGPIIGHLILGLSQSIFILDIDPISEKNKYQIMLTSSKNSDIKAPIKIISPFRSSQ